MPPDPAAEPQLVRLFQTAAGSGGIPPKAVLEQPSSRRVLGDLLGRRNIVLSQSDELGHRGNKAERNRAQGRTQHAGSVSRLVKVAAQRTGPTLIGGNPPKITVPTSGATRGAGRRTGACTVSPSSRTAALAEGMLLSRTPVRKTFQIIAASGWVMAGHDTRESIPCLPQFTHEPPRALGAHA
jgi:hypothetical protein